MVLSNARDMQVAVFKDVCCWHKRTCKTALVNVRFDGNNGHDADVTRCLLMTQSGHAPSSTGWKTADRL